MAELLTEQMRTTTMAAVRTMFPHEALPDEAYAKVMRQLEADAHGDETILPTIEAGIAALDEGGPFAERGEDERLAALTDAQDTPFFKLLHATAVVELYDNPLVWKALGYEGPSVHHGGFLHDFDDLDWLPDPPPISPVLAKERGLA